MDAKGFSFICLLIGGIGAHALAQTPVWTQSANYPGSTSRNDDIHFLDETNGWAVAGGTGQIYKTTDGGKNWVLKYTKTGAHFRSIGFVSAQRGFAGNLGVGSYDTTVTDTNVLYQTSDGGETWSVFPGLSETGMKGFCAFHVLDSRHIYGGGRVRGPAYFVKSDDAGTNWTVVNLTAQGVMNGIMDVYFKDATNGFVVGMDTNSYASGFYNGCIAKTTNGGATWTPDVITTNISTCYFWKMAWPTPNIGYVTLQKNPIWSGSVVFYKTIDGGNSWTSNSFSLSAIGLSSFYTQGIGFVNATEGWMGGDGNTAPYANNFLHTVDGGLNWIPAGYTDSRRINRIRFLNPNFGYAAGFKLHIFRPLLSITAQPQSATNAAGSSTTFTVTAQGTPPLVYQWRFNGTNLSGANTNSYSITNVQTVNTGKYDVVVGDVSGSVTSSAAMLSISGVVVAPVITNQPQSQSINQGSTAIFSVAATGTPPLTYQWQFNGVNISGATATNYTRSNAQTTNSGGYSVIVTNSGGITTSIVATLVVQTNILFENNFDGYSSPNVVTNAGTTNGYKIYYRAASGPVDFKAIFGFDYSSVTYPKNIPSAPRSIGGTTKGLFLTVNKDTTNAAAAVNLYPTNQFYSGNFALKFDMWINWADVTTSTEHALFGINHSGNVTNRIGQTPSDGLFFAVEGENDSSPTDATLRDFSVFRGRGNGLSPFLMTTNNTTFGPTPLLAPQFDNTNPGLVALFPAQTISGYGTTPAGTAGLRWIQSEVRQENNLITWLLNGIAIAQYTNTYGYTNGNILIGYNDHYTSTGDSNNFVIFDNIRVESISISPVQLLSPEIAGANFSFSFATEPYESYTVQRATNLTTPDWVVHTNLVGNGTTNIIVVPLVNESAQQYFRVIRP